MQNKNLTSFLHRKFLRFDKSQPFISITAILAFLGISIGVMVLIVAMAIMNGMSKEFEKRLFVMSYPLTLHPLSRGSISSELVTLLEANFPNLSFSPYIYSQAVARINGKMDAAILFGVNPKKEAKINPIFAKTIESSDVLENFINDKFSIIIGESLVNEHFLATHDKIMLYFTKLEPTGLVLSPITKRFNLQGSFSSGISAYDSAYMYVNLEALAIIKNMPKGVYDGIHIFSKDPMRDIHTIREFLESKGIHNVSLEGWWQRNSNLFAAMNLEKNVLFIVLMLIILMASLNIISSLLMVVMNRRKEIALLLSLGASKKEIKKTFFYLGASIGILGIIFGVIMAFIVMWALQTFPIIDLPADVYGFSHLPLALLPLDFCATIIGAVCIVCLSSYYPARQASKIDALNVLRNE